MTGFVIICLLLFSFIVYFDDYCADGISVLVTFDGKSTVSPVQEL